VIDKNAAVLLDGIARDEAKIREIRTRQYGLERSVKLIVADKLDMDHHDVVLGTWDCDESPTGSCVYNDETDPCHDQCVVCGDPDERK
jgi:hypothetical protein